MIYLIQAYISELEKLLSQAQHPKIVKLLQDALDKNRKDVSSHQQPATAVRAVRAKAKNDKPSTYYVPIDTYGES